MCLVTSTPREASPVDHWLAALRSISNLHFGAAIGNDKSGSIHFDVNIDSLRTGDPPLQQPEPAVLQAVPDLPCWLAFDVETNDLVPSPPSNIEWTYGKFGHQCRLGHASLENLRMVQLGWCMQLPNCTDIKSKTYNIIPDGFDITSAAESKHHISKADLQESGRPLRHVLDEFLLDVLAIINVGGAVCAHQLEFDAAIIAVELEEAGLHNKLALWEQTVQDGICTMNPDVSKWSCQIYFDVAAAPSFAGRANAVGICNMILALLPTEYKCIEQHHDAGVDAQMVCKLVGELQRRLERYR